ncbi:hypothetical protein HPP92_023102 [Vanilla planifolia]|uniref:Uncharacterized protein n=1 Tax=Vanilla planifolia TaxID=51239 RepID=A0A835PYQ5_VANPL|nr:hypothetical protein HPP92_023102 [Vanilla planifolia]
MNEDHCGLLLLSLLRLRRRLGVSVVHVGGLSHGKTSFVVFFFLGIFSLGIQKLMMVPGSTSTVSCRSPAIFTRP